MVSTSRRQQLVLAPAGGAAQKRAIDPARERQTFRFRLAAEDLVQGSLDLVLDYPGERPADGFVHFYRLMLRTVDANGAQAVAVDLAGAAAIADACPLNDIRWRDSRLGEVFVITGPRPRLTLRFATPGTMTGGQLEVGMGAPRSLDYAVAYDGFVAEENALIDRIRELEHALKREQNAVEKLRAYKAEIDEIKRSKVWRLTAAYRDLVYERLLVNFPGMRQRLLYLTREGPARSWQLLKRKLAGGGTVTERPVTTTPAPARPVARYYDYRFTDERRAAVLAGLGELRRRPLVSIVMPVYNVDPRWLRSAIESVEQQLYGNWELCIVDDASTREATIAFLKTLRHPRVRVRFLDRNLNIAGATNEAIRFSRGEYLAFLDNDDCLTPDALYEAVRAIDETGADLVYSDEDFIDLDGHYCQPHFKPDHSPDLLLSHNYITHLVVVEKRLVEAAGLMRDRCNGAQDYDLMLRVTEQARQIHHIPRVLYHWRKSETSTSYSAAAKPGALLSARLALEDTLVRRGIDGEVLDEKVPFFFRVRRRIVDAPLVSIVIPFRDKPDLLRLCVGSIIERSTWTNYEIVAISNNSQSSETWAAVDALAARSEAFRCIECNEEFNFSRLVNFGAAQARGDYLLILNNDIEVISWDWIEAMLEHAQRPEVGAVGAKLYYPNDSVQHAGIILGLGGYAGHSHKLAPASAPGYFNRLNVIQDVSAVTGACLMVARETFERVGGFDETSFKVAYNDVDFCLRLRELGLFNIFTPYAELYHHESISRGYEDSEAKQQRFDGEKQRLKARHGWILEHGDPFYNPNLTQDHEDFSIRPHLHG